MKNIIKTVAFLLIFIMGVCFSDKLYNPGGDGAWFQANTILDFYKRDKNSIDVIYAGDSGVYAGISPLEIYERTGITGYAYSTPGQRVWSSYYLIKETMKTQNPKLVFVETGEFFEKPKNQDELSIRNAIDSLKMSQNKLDMIMDKSYPMTYYERLTAIFPVMRYHSRWDSLKEYDIRKFRDKAEYTYDGYLLDARITKIDSSENKKEKQAIISNGSKISKASSEYFKKINELCKKNNCTLILVSMPTPRNWNQERHDEIQKLADTENVDFIDMNYDDKITINWDDDTQDGGDHLNIYGAEKVGTYLSNYITSKFDMVNHKEDKAYQRWNNDLVRYNTAKDKKKNQESQN